MEIDWGQVKAITLWQYEQLIEKLLDTLSYPFILELYNHNMQETSNYALKIRQGYFQDRKEASTISEMVAHFSLLGELGVRNYFDLVQQVETKTKCEQFILETGFNFKDLIQVLNYIFRMVLPFKIPVKELGYSTSQAERSAVEVLRQYKIRSNLDVLENFRVREIRLKWAMETGVADAFLRALLHRADISRLAYVRGKTVLHLCGGGYDTLDKIAGADLKIMEADMAAYYQTIGKQLSDFRAVIPLKWMVGGAKILPRVVES